MLGLSQGKKWVWLKKKCEPFLNYFPHLNKLSHFSTYTTFIPNKTPAPALEYISAYNKLCSVDSLTVRCVEERNQTCKLCQFLHRALKTAWLVAILTSSLCIKSAKKSMPESLFQGKTAIEDAKSSSARQWLCLFVRIPCARTWTWTEGKWSWDIAGFSAGILANEWC